MIENFVDAARKSIDQKNWYAALTLALVLPDICSSLEDPGPGKVFKRYVGWCRKYLEPKFTHSVGSPPKLETFLSAEDCFQARNSIVHEGSPNVDKNKRNKIDRFEFFSEGSHMNYVGGVTVNGVAQPNYLQLRVDLFCEAIFEAVADWQTAISGKQEMETKLKTLLKLNEPGTQIGPIMWG